MRRAAALALCGLLAACAGVPIGRHTFVAIGVSVVRVDPAASATGVRAVTAGLTLGCGGLTFGVTKLECARLPPGDVAVIWPAGVAIHKLPEPARGNAGNQGAHR